ncbi:MAG: 50S ribosomal protein L29 [Candidatus Omnitrophica bacterium]|nr:50S ribosomal protein L29 [Candidatus Omnitrophota bacterium]
MKIAELKNLSDAELEQKKISLQGDLFKLNFEKFSGRVDKPHNFSLYKKDIARIETILRERRK